MNSESEKRLAVFLATSGHSGVDRVMTNLIGEFARRGVGVDLLRVANHGPYLDESLPGLRIVDLGTSHVNSSLPAVVRYLRRRRPHAMLSDKDRVNRAALLARRLSGVKTRAAVRVGTTVSINLSRRGWFHRKMQYFSIRRIYPWADVMITPSEGAADDLARIAGVSRDRVRVLPSPVGGDHAERRAVEPVDHPWFKAPDGPPIVLGVGELCARKDFSTLIEAFALVRREREARLVILGKGRQRERLEALARDLGIESDTLMPGFVSNPFAYMSKASVFVLSSVCEGAPVVLMEALSLGLPVVSTDCPSGPREILENGRYGPLAPVGNREILAREILNTLEKPLDPDTLKSAASPYQVAESANRYLEALDMTDHA
ncbi:MAG: glycosyltransferase [Desulfobacterales bacterium]|nr:glycosyltransferase [Desulfobacterales bacterium]